MVNITRLRYEHLAHTEGALICLTCASPIANQLRCYEALRSEQEAATSDTDVNTNACNSPAQLETLAKEGPDNKRQATVDFGQELQLRHVKSGKFLTFKEAFPAEQPANKGKGRLVKVRLAPFTSSYTSLTLVSGLIVRLSLHERLHD